jgi:hypothetical protein
VTIAVKVLKTKMDIPTPKLNQESRSDLNRCETESAWPIHGALMPPNLLQCYFASEKAFILE